MAQWGRNDQSVTANSSTTVETSNGAPIGTWALVKGDQVNRVDGANAHFGNTSSGSRAGVDVAMFGNTTADAFIVGKAVGVFGVDANEQQAIRASGVNRPSHAGWVLRTEGSGGRAGRVQYETLVAMGSLGAQSAAYGTPALVSDAEDTVAPDAFLRISSQPVAASANAANNDSKVFSVGVTNVPAGATPSYLWYFSTTSGTTGFATTVGNTAFSGQTTANLTVNSATIAVNTWVKAVISVTGGASVNTSAVKLTLV